MEGKAREIIAMISRRVKARARQRQDGQRPIEGAGREDKACKTSETAHHRTDTLLRLFCPTHSVVEPGERMDGVDMKPSQGSGQATGDRRQRARVRSQDPPPPKRFG
ncbi:hypothetical protein A4X13_0g9486, partial [Tilletia indica]